MMTMIMGDSGNELKPRRGFVLTLTSKGKIECRLFVHAYPISLSLPRCSLLCDENCNQIRQFNKIMRKSSKVRKFGCCQFGDDEIYTQINVMDGIVIR